MAGQLGPAKIGHEAADQTRSAVSETVGFIELRLGDIRLIEGAIKLVLDLADLTFRDREKLDELSVSAALEPFGNVRSWRNRRAPDLIDKSKVRRERFRSGKSVNRATQFACGLPCFDILKTFDRSHPSSLVRQNPKLKTQNSEPRLLAPITRRATIRRDRNSRSGGKRVPGA